MATSSTNPSRLSVESLAQLLKNMGARSADVAAIERDIADGAPVNDDGTINIIHYTAWLLKESSNGLTN